MYSPSLVPNKEITIAQGTYSIEQILNLLRPYGINHILNNETYLIEVRSIPNSKRISGYVRDRKSGEALIGATVSLNDGRHGVVTNNYGYYSLSIDRNDKFLKIGFIGYQDLVDSITEFTNVVKNYVLDIKTRELDEIVVESQNIFQNVTSTIPGEKYLDFNQKSQIPYFLGEVDILQKSLLLPGVRTLGEDASGLNVRGGSIDQNLLLLDEAVIYNPNHFYGLVSVFNPEAVNRMKIMKGFIPPKYGGRASSVITVHQKEGNKYRYDVSGGIGIVSGRLMVEGPISKGKSSFLISGRQSIYDLSLDGFDYRIFRESKTSFQDINLKLNWIINNNNSFFFSGYFGDDRNRAGFDAIRKWGNRTLSARWNHSFGKRFFANYTGVFSDYVYRITDPVEAGSFIGKSSIIDYSLKLNHQYYQNIHSKFEFGGEFTFHRLKPGERLPIDENDSSTNALILEKEHGIEYALYVGHEFDVNHILKLNYGIRYSGLMTYGPQDVFIYDGGRERSSNSIIDTIHVDHRKTVDSFKGIEPRISLNLKLDQKKSVKISYNRSNQYLHLISNTASPEPTDVWQLSDRYIPPVKSNHVSVGFYQNYGNDDWETSFEIYYKDLTDIVEYKDGADLLFNPNSETELLSGIGRAYGFEYYLEKKSGKYRGWISYTLSRSERKVKGKFPGETINNGNYFPDDYDKTHDLSVVGIYNHNNRLSFSMIFNYSSGRPITFPSGKYRISGIVVPHFEGRNQDRISDYHRMDLAAKWRPKAKKERKLQLTDSYWTFTIYNLYARRNAYSYFFRQSETNPELTEVIRYSIFGMVIPAITYNFKF